MPELQKIVVEFFRDGGYECGSYLSIACVEYESIEAFYIHFNERLTAYITAYEEYRALERIYDTNIAAVRGNWFKAQKLSQKRPKVIEEANALYQATQATAPKQPDGTFELAGKTWCFEDFLIRGDYKDYNYPYFKVDNLDFRLLDDWFESKLKDIEP